MNLFQKDPTSWHFNAPSVLSDTWLSCFLLTHAPRVLDSEASPGSDGEGLAERTSCSFGSATNLAPGPCDAAPPASMEEIQVELQCADLWKRFHDIGTEMIITKAGRWVHRVSHAPLQTYKQHPPVTSPGSAGTWVWHSGGMRGRSAVGPRSIDHHLNNMN